MASDGFRATESRDLSVMLGSSNSVGLLLVLCYDFLIYLFHHFFKMCVYVHMLACGHGGQKGRFDPLELEVKIVVSCPVWILGSTLPPS